MNNKLFNSQGKQLYTNPESIKKAMKRRKDTLYCKGLLKYRENVSLFVKADPKALTI